ncbi:hypothetical protein ACHAWF_016798 [Thalassiosira exigua]
MQRQSAFDLAEVHSRTPFPDIVKDERRRRAKAIRGSSIITIWSPYWRPFEFGIEYGAGRDFSEGFSHVELVFGSEGIRIKSAGFPTYEAAEAGTEKVRKTKGKKFVKFWEEDRLFDPSVDNSMDMASPVDPTNGYTRRIGDDVIGWHNMPERLFRCISEGQGTSVIYQIRKRHYKWWKEDNASNSMQPPNIVWADPNAAARPYHLQQQQQHLHQQQGPPVINYNNCNITHINHHYAAAPSIAFPQQLVQPITNPPTLPSTFGRPPSATSTPCQQQQQWQQYQQQQQQGQQYQQPPQQQPQQQQPQQQQQRQPQQQHQQSQQQQQQQSQQQQHQQQQPQGWQPPPQQQQQQNWQPQPHKVIQQQELPQQGRHQQQPQPHKVIQQQGLQQQGQQHHHQKHDGHASSSLFESPCSRDGSLVLAPSFCNDGQRDAEECSGSPNHSGALPGAEVFSHGDMDCDAISRINSVRSFSFDASVDSREGIRQEDNIDKGLETGEGHKQDADGTEISDVAAESGLHDRHDDVMREFEIAAEDEDGDQEDISNEHENSIATIQQEEYHHQGHGYESSSLLGSSSHREQDPMTWSLDEDGTEHCTELVAWSKDYLQRKSPSTTLRSNPRSTPVPGEGCDARESGEEGEGGGRDKGSGSSGNYGGEVWYLAREEYLGADSDGEDCEYDGGLESGATDESKDDYGSDTSGARLEHKALFRDDDGDGGDSGAAESGQYCCPENELNDRGSEDCSLSNHHDLSDLTNNYGGGNSSQGSNEDSAEAKAWAEVEAEASAATPDAADATVDTGSPLPYKVREDHRPEPSEAGLTPLSPLPAAPLLSIAKAREGGTDGSSGAVLPILAQENSNKCDLSRESYALESLDDQNQSGNFESSFNSQENIHPNTRMAEAMRNGQVVSRAGRRGRPNQNRRSSSSSNSLDTFASRSSGSASWSSELYACSPRPGRFTIELQGATGGTNGAECRLPPHLDHEGHSDEGDEGEDGEEAKSDDYDLVPTPSNTRLNEGLNQGDKSKESVEMSNREEETRGLLASESNAHQVEEEGEDILKPVSVHESPEQVYARDSKGHSETEVDHELWKPGDSSSPPKATLEANLGGRIIRCTVTVQGKICDCNVNINDDKGPLTPSIILRIFSFFNAGQLFALDLQNLPPLLAAAAKKALSQLMLASTSCDPSAQSSLSKSRWCWDAVKRRYTNWQFLSDGGSKKVYRVWNAHCNTDEAMSVM